MAQVSFRMDDTLKESAEKTFKAMGMTMSTAINIFVSQTVRRGEFPFVIKADPFYSESNLRTLRQRAKDMDEGRNCVEHEFLSEETSSHV